MKVEYKYELTARQEYAEQLKEYFERFLKYAQYEEKATEFQKIFLEKGYVDEEISATYLVKIDDYVIDSRQIYFQAYNSVKVIVSVPETLLSYQFSPDRVDLVSSSYTKERNQAGAIIKGLMDKTSKTMQEEYATKQADIATKEREDKIRKENEDLRNQNEKAKLRLVHLAWAQEHGSDQLRKGLEQGYSCLKQYEKEYGIWVLGDEYEWDRDGAVEEKTRSCPSLKALEIVEELVKDERIGQRNADIQWLPDGLSGLVKEEEWDEDTKKGCEAISVKIRDITGLWYKVI